MKRRRNDVDFPLNGLSISQISVNQDGNLEVEFDLPVEQTTSRWHTELKGSRSFDIYEDEELKEVCRRLFHLVRERVKRPDPEREAVHCDHCATSACCRKYNVLLRDQDIERLAGFLRITAREFTRRYTDPAVDWCSDYPRQLACDQDEEGKEKCLFLKRAPNGQWRCSVYRHRPRICRDFDMHTCGDFVTLEEVHVLKS